MGRRGIVLELLAYLLAGASLVFGAVHERLDPPPFHPGPRAAGIVRVATWNVGSGLDSGGGGLDDEHLEHVARVLEELDADLCFLQELTGRFQLRRLARELGRDRHGQERESAISPGPSTRRVAALARRGSLETFDMSSAGRRALGVVYRSGDLDLAAVSLHADAFSAESRNAEIGAATEALLARDAAARLLLGDLNLDLDLDKRRDLFTDDAYLDVETYNYVAGRLTDAARGAGTTAEPDRRLDYVFVDPDAIEVVTAGVWKDQRLGGMDHDPVVVDLRLRR